MRQWLKNQLQGTKINQAYLVLVAICAVYAGIALGNMSRWSIWFDEAFSAYLIRFNLTEITHFTSLDVHPPFYYWLLKLWSGVFGTGELALRSMSMLFGVLTLIGLFMLLQRLFSNSRWALFATGVVALLPLFVRFGHEARMYTLVLAIVTWATYLLVRAMAKDASRWWWAGYGLLLAVGMLTHYYAALAWLAHWAWRYSEKRAGRVKQFFSREWLWTHALAIGLFAWWLPTAIRQFTTVQTMGFWIPPISAYTPIDYLSNMLLYRQYGEATGWWAVLLLVSASLGAVALWRGGRAIAKRSTSGVGLLVAMAVVPALILVVASMPPLTSTFMDRYILYAQISLVVLVTLSIAALYDTKKTRHFAALAGVSLVAILVLGIGNVYYYGNYNKNSSTSIRVKEVMRSIDSASGSGVQPVIASSPWIYYEAVFYESDDHPVYFLDSSTEYHEGSLAMLLERDTNKIKDVHEFASQHRYVWYLGSQQSGDVEPPVAAWQRIISVEAYDSIDDNVKYRASLFDTRPSVE